MDISVKDRIKDEINIEDIVSEYVSLSQKGKNLTGLSPFTNEKTPSFTVNIQKGTFKCFSSNKNGDVINFIQEVENLTFIEALEFLGNKIGIEVKNSKSNMNPQLKEMYSVNEEVMKYYSLLLLNNASGKKYLEYLDKRNISHDTIRKFYLGAASDKGIMKKIKDHKYNDFDFNKCSLMNQYGNDFFRDRLIVPIIDENNRVRGFCGRTISNEENIKYLLIQENLVFKKRDLLYNYNKKKVESLIIFEGFFDVIMAVQNGIENCIATMGTSISDKQLEKIKKITENVILCYDSDTAGINATINNGKIFKDYGFNVSCVKLLPKYDPCDYINEFGVKGFDKVLKRKVSVVEFNYQYLRSIHDLENSYDKELFISDVCKATKKYNFEETYHALSKLAKDLNVPREYLFDDYEKSSYKIKSWVTKDEKIKRYESILKKNNLLQ